MARNSFAGPCYRCGLTVEPNTGHFERQGGVWRVRHHDHPQSPGTVTCAMAKARTDHTPPADHRTGSER